MNNDSIPPEDPQLPPVVPPQVNQPIPPVSAHYPRQDNMHNVQPNANENSARFLIPLNPSPLAVVAGYAGLFACTSVLAPAAIIFGVLALKQLKQNPNMTGKGRAYFGLIMGVIGTLAFIYFLIVGLPKNGE